MPRRKKDGTEQKSRSKSRNTMSKYQVLSVIGEGAYGVVMKCKNKQTGQLVALKKFKESGETDELVRKTILREVKVLRMMRHIEPIVHLIESFQRKGKLYLVFEYLPRSLLEIIDDNPDGLPPPLVANFTYQLCAAIAECHKMQVLHRDIKPENLLVDDRHFLKLCDFGFARVVEAYGELLTDYVATRWYRAPELLVGDEAYGPGVDIWAIACIMAELIDGEPLFAGDSEIDQLFAIQKMLGPMTQKHSDVFTNNPRFKGLRFPDMSDPDTLESRYLDMTSQENIKFMSKLLSMEPNARPSAKECLQCSVFDEVRHIYAVEKPDKTSRKKSGGNSKSKSSKLLNSQTKSQTSSLKNPLTSIRPKENTGGLSLYHSTIGSVMSKAPHYGSHKKTASFSFGGAAAPIMLAKNSSHTSSTSMLPNCRDAKELTSTGDMHRRTVSENLGSGSKTVASFSQLHTSHSEQIKDSKAPPFPSIDEQISMHDNTRLRFNMNGRTLSDNVQRLHSPMMQRRVVSSEFGDPGKHKVACLQVLYCSNKKLRVYQQIYSRFEECAAQSMPAASFDHEHLFLRSWNATR